jgi:DNA (cytosine-5)-methyltransferase 1
LRKKLKIISLFTGAGGLDLGFEKTGLFESVACIESEPLFYETLRINKSKGFMKRAKIFNDSVGEIKVSTFLKQNNLKSVNGVIGGPPCESFSAIGKRDGITSSKGKLVFDFFDWVVNASPNFFLMENVPRLANIENGSVLKKLIRIPAEAGYKVNYKILNASHFGAATKRERLFLIGVKSEKPFEWPSRSHGESDLFNQLIPFVTTQSAFEDLPKASKEKPGFPQGHYEIKHSDVVKKRFSALKQGQWDKVRKRAKLCYASPSPALVAGNLSGIRSHIHPELPRELTNRESARLHGFPDEFEFFGNHASMGKQIANSVPVQLAEALAKSIAKCLMN